MLDIGLAPMLWWNIAGRNPGVSPSETLPVLGKSQSALINSDFMAGLMSLTSLQNFGPHLPLLYNGLTSRKVITSNG
jgi:hypothetical protein